MSMVFEFEEEIRGSAKIKIVGVGGGGCNAVNSMIELGLKGVEFIALNTDAQALKNSKADVKIQIGTETTKGLGAGANPEIGRLAMEESKDKLTNLLADANMVFIASGMGGGTGTGAAPVVANIASDLGALTVAVVTKPFKFEGAKRKKNADHGINVLKENVDTLIVVHNQRLIDSVAQATTMVDAFHEVDSVLHKAIRGTTDLITIEGEINLDFADVKTVMQGMGDAMMGVGEASGDHRSVEAIQSAIQSSLLENVDIKGASGILINFTGSKGMTLFEINDAMDVIYDAAGGDDANIIFGTVIDEEMDDTIRVTVIATGFNSGHTDNSNNLDNSFTNSNNSRINSNNERLENFNNRSNNSFKSNNIEEPAISRRAVEVDNNRNQERKAMSNVNSENKSLSSVLSAPAYDGVDYELPAFLRNNKD